MKGSKTECLMELVYSGIPLRDAAKKSGLSYDAARGIYSREKKRRLAIEYGSTNAEEQAREFREREKERLSARELKNLQQERLSEEEVRSKIMGLAAVPPSPPTWLLDKPTSSTIPGVPLTIWSDWHYGEVVHPEEVNGVNYYNIEIAERRVRTIVERTISLCFDHMVNPVYPYITICLGGDMLSGEIHDELKATNEQEVIACIPRLRDLLLWAIRTMADKFGRVFLPCVAGNHGRTTRRCEAKRFVYKNFDWLIYSLLQRDLANDPRIAFYVPPSNEAYFTIYDRRFLLLHGHDIGVKGGDGIIGAYGPLRRGLIKVGRQQAQIGRSFDTLLMGHWHQYIPGSDLTVNNCLKGYDEFAATMLRAPASTPSQALFFVHPKLGITYQLEVFAERVMKPQEFGATPFRPFN